jgi:NADH-quinone oxidoreductase subunit A
MGFQFAAILAFAAVAIGFMLGGLTVGHFIRPHFPEADKGMIYECGERPVRQAWFNFNPRFYLVALVFVIFEVDIALTFPVVAVYREWVQQSMTMGWIALVELFLFTAILVVGLIWVWGHGDLEWVKTLAKVEGTPRPITPPAPRSTDKAA